MKSLLWIAILGLDVITGVQARPGLDERNASPVGSFPPSLRFLSSPLEGLDVEDEGGGGDPWIDFGPLPQPPQLPEPDPGPPVLTFHVSVKTTLTPSSSSTYSSKVTAVASPLPPPPPPSSSATPPPDCRTTLSCTFDEIQTWTMARRVQYMQDMQALRFGPLKAQDQFRAIQAVIDLFQEKGSGAVGTWVSYVDAGIVEAIQRGAGIALNLHNDDGGNPGSRLWLSFFNQMKAGQLADRNAHDAAWSKAEATATEYGREKAEARGLKAIGNEFYWYEFTVLFRYIMQNRASFIQALSQDLNSPPGPDDGWIELFIDWMTDVTDYQAAKVCLEISWTASEIFSLPELSLTQLAKQLQAILNFIQKLVDAWRKTTNRPSPPLRPPKAGGPNTN